MAVVATCTFQIMGLRTEQSAANHLLLESNIAFESNLVSDIGKVEYLHGHLGQTHLEPIECLPVFVYDVHIWGALRTTETVSVRRRLSCTTGKDGASKKIVAHISLALRESMGKKADSTSRGYIQTNLVHKVAAKANFEGSRIRETVDRIECDTAQ